MFQFWNKSQPKNGSKTKSYIFEDHLQNEPVKYFPLVGIWCCHEWEKSVIAENCDFEIKVDCNWAKYIKMWISWSFSFVYKCLTSKLADNISFAKINTNKYFEHCSISDSHGCGKFGLSCNRDWTLTRKEINTLFLSFHFIQDVEMQFTLRTCKQMSLMSLYLVSIFTERAVRQKLANVTEISI